MSSFSPDSEPNTVDTNTESLQYSESLKESESKWKGDKLSWFSKAGFWSSAQSYLGRITSAVQEETQGLTLSKVKKDLEEFSQQLYSEVQGLQMAISKESEKQKETNRGVVADSFVPFIPNDGTNESQKVSSGKEYTSHHSQMNSENVDDSLYWVPEPFCQLMEPFLSHYRMKALEVHNNPALFLDVSIPKDESQSFNEEMESVVDSLSPQILERCSCIKVTFCISIVMECVE